MTILVALSGGLDSSWVLWHLLRTTETPLVAFHLNLVCAMNRHIPEERAADGVVAWCEANVRLLEGYEKATLDMGDLIGWMDGPLVAAPAIAAMLNHPDTNSIATGRCIDEAIGFDGRTMQGSLPGFNDVARVAWLRLFPDAGNGVSRNGQELRIVEPAMDARITKLEMREQMPKELYDLTWSCHRPVVTPAGFAPCGICRSCLLREGNFPPMGVSA